MLVTLTWVPPSWETRLPQKFSAATTLITVFDPVLDELALVEEVKEELVEPLVRYRPAPNPTTKRITITAAGTTKLLPDLALLPDIPSREEHMVNKSFSKCNNY
jgi:hypothetical protein